MIEEQVGQDPFREEGLKVDWRAIFITVGTAILVGVIIVTQLQINVLRNNQKDTDEVLDLLVDTQGAVLERSQIHEQALIQLFELNGIDVTKETSN